jgi:Txe/YoeB family toxin of Txe-Axe toxin-antitoxin module
MGHSLHIRVEKKEGYLIEKIMSLIRDSFPKMAYLVMDPWEIIVITSDEYQNYDEEYSRRIIQQITRRTCEEFEKLGEVKIIKTKYDESGFD